ncbi:MAG: hypothetical protein ACE5NL_01985 [Candidatus Hydrothermarchaeaceae archaeon]
MTRKQVKKIPRKKTESELAWLKIKGKYPNCSGSYPECPPEITDKMNPPAECLLCPVYMEWKK